MSIHEQDKIRLIYGNKITILLPVILKTNSTILKIILVFFVFEKVYLALYQYSVVLSEIIPIIFIKFINKIYFKLDI